MRVQTVIPVREEDRYLRIGGYIIRRAGKFGHTWQRLFQSGRQSEEHLLCSQGSDANQLLAGAPSSDYSDPKFCDAQCVGQQRDDRLIGFAGFRWCGYSQTQSVPGKAHHLVPRCLGLHPYFNAGGITRTAV